MCMVRARGRPSRCYRVECDGAAAAATSAATSGPVAGAFQLIYDGALRRESAARHPHGNKGILKNPTQGVGPPKCGGRGRVRERTTEKENKNESSLKSYTVV